MLFTAPRFYTKLWNTLVSYPLAHTDTFTTFTSAKAEDFGRFVLDSVPALDGQILYYKDRTSTEAVKAVPILREEILRDGPLPLLTLTLVSDSSLPFLVQGPKDTVAPRDSLTFRFNQGVDALDGYMVRLINQGPLLLDTIWIQEKTLLKIRQRGANWVRGKKYEYEVKARNGSGQYFTAQGDSQKVLKGIFYVPDSSLAGDSTLMLPKNIAFSCFNSGGYYLFAETDTNSSPKPDSSSQYARLKWYWSKSTGRKPDSLLLYYKDDGLSAENWELWGAVTGSQDSATLVLSDHYTTSLEASERAPLPFKTPGGRLHFKVIPKHAGISYPETTLVALEQAMGPTVYSQISKKNDSLKTGPGAVDTLKVEFLKTEKVLGSIFNWGGVPPTPSLYFNGVRDSSKVNLDWVWADGKTGWVIYKLPTVINGNIRVRVDLNGEPYQNKPVWHRNRKNEFVLP